MLDSYPAKRRIDLQRGVPSGAVLLESPSRNVMEAPSGGVRRASILHPPVERSYNVPVPLALPENVDRH
jgi:hypothetical protein